jgi:S-adenosylmethionine:tRNA ribosyltransferase-isomerase
MMSDVVGAKVPQSAADVATSDFEYELPADQIAQHPLAERDGARLLCLDRTTGQWQHSNFRNVIRCLKRPSLLVVNNSKVFPARLIGRRDSGGQVELLLVRCLEETPRRQRWRCLGKPRRKLRPGLTFRLGDLDVVIEEADDEGLVASLSSTHDVREEIWRIGHVPLPPYIRRPVDASDRDRYQTIFASTAEGSVAAPTAGLHFTEELVGELRSAGHELVEVTLHVGPGTFRPVRTANLGDHLMDHEWYHVSEATADAVNQARSQGRPVVAVGTTAVRTLESAGSGGVVRAGSGVTGLFITPGYAFAVVEGLVTNFHLPRSTLLALVCAFAGREPVMAAYRDAVRRGYRFYSYGDAMLVTGDAASPCC